MRAGKGRTRVNLVRPLLCVLTKYVWEARGTMDVVKERKIHA